MNNYVDVEELMAGGSTLKRSVKPEDIVTMKADMRFPNVQQTYACWAKYNEFLLCANKLGPDTGVCHRLLRDALCACPQDWIDMWRDQRKDGLFTGVQSEHFLQTPEDDDDDDSDDDDE